AAPRRPLLAPGVRPAAERLDELGVGQPAAEAERHAHEGRVRQARREDPVPLLIAGNVVEEQRARVLAAVVELAGGADLKRRAHPGDMLELTRLLGRREPGA